MAHGYFERALPIVLKYEGGWSDHPRDPGGATMKGVTQKTYNAYRDRIRQPRQSVRYISDRELQSIYKEGYWDTIGGDTLAAGVDLAAFDLAVNSGPGRTRQLLPKAVGSNDHSVTVKRLCDLRMGFLRRLGTWNDFGKGWTRRVLHVEATGVAWALSAMGKPKETITAELKTRSDQADAKAKKQATGGAAAGTGGSATAGGAAALEPSSFDWTAWLFVGSVVVILLGLAVFLLTRAMRNRKRAEAYDQAAVEEAGRL